MSDEIDDNFISLMEKLLGKDQVFVIDSAEPVNNSDGNWPEEDAQDEEDAVHRALLTIVEHRNEKSLNYCVNYAKAGLVMSGKDLRIQVLYVLNNMQYWRGPVAKEVRSVLKEYVK